MALFIICAISILGICLCYSIYNRKEVIIWFRKLCEKERKPCAEVHKDSVKKSEIIPKNLQTGFRRDLKNRKLNDNEKLTNDVIYYNKYDMNSKEYIKYFSQASICTIACGYVFFRNPCIIAVLWLLSFIYPRVKKKELIKKRKKQLSLQFRDALQAVSSSLSAGRSIENAFKAAVDDLKILYPAKDTYIIKEFEVISRKIDMNETLKNALYDFKQRADIDDITNFVDVLTICKDTGGNLVEVIKNTCSIINQKIDILNEIDVIVAEQKFSQKILNIMPFGLLFMIITSSPDYIKPLYTLTGHIVMFIVLVLLFSAYYISTRIMDIRV